MSRIAVKRGVPAAEKWRTHPWVRHFSVIGSFGNGEAYPNYEDGLVVEQALQAIQDTCETRK